MVLKVADRSNNINIDTWSRSTNDNSAFSVPYPGLYLDWQGSSRSKAFKYYESGLTANFSINLSDSPIWILADSQPDCQQFCCTIGGVFCFFI